MKYSTPELILVGAAEGLVLGSSSDICPFQNLELPESRNDPTF